MTPREALNELLGRVPSAQSQHAEPARLVLEQTIESCELSVQIAAGLVASEARVKELEALVAAQANELEALKPPTPPM